MSVMEFYDSIYNFTPAHAHADDVNAAIIDSTDREVITPTSGETTKG